ncbi:MAG: hypothetical protein RQ867_06255 [Mariprofundaceae bacterium]|nr:hypothetical protein [Mariprofundaceae bacterium]
MGGSLKLQRVAGIMWAVPPVAAEPAHRFGSEDQGGYEQAELLY